MRVGAICVVVAGEFRDSTNYLAVDQTIGAPKSRGVYALRSPTSAFAGLPRCASAIICAIYSSRLFIHRSTAVKFNAGSCHSQMKF